MSTVSKSNVKLNINHKDICDRTALHHAAAENNLLLVEQSLSQGAELDAKDLCDYTPLHYAAEKNRNDSHFEVADLLLKNGADPNARNSNGETPLYCFAKHCSVKIILLFLKFKADMGTVTYSGCNLLFPVSRINKNIEILQLLINFGLDINHARESGETPLHAAATNLKSCKLEIMKFLLKNGADMNLVNKQGYNALFQAVDAYFYLHDYDENKLDNHFNFLIEHTDFSLIPNSKDIFENKFRSPVGHFLNMILRHLAKLQVLNIPIHPDILNIVLSHDTDYFQYFKECSKELLVAKNTKLKRSWVTFFNLLVDDRKKLKNYSGNRDLIEDFKKVDFSKQFPIYGSSMDKNVKKGIKRRERFDNSADLLSNCLPIFNPTHLIIRDVLDCVLSKKDLLKFCK